MLNKKLLSLSEVSRSQLSKILHNAPGPKCIILERNIIKPLERICGVAWLKNSGVEKIYKLEEVAPDYDKAAFYIIYANFATFRKVVDQICSKLDLENPAKNKYHVVLVPKSLYAFDNILEEFGLAGNVVRLYSLQWQPIYLDEGIISLEVPDIYKMLYIYHDLSFLPIFAKSLWHLSFIAGKPQFYLGLGQNSIAVIKQLTVLYANLATTDILDSDFGAVVLVDRNMDYPSALLTPTTYAALLNDVYKVECGFCEYKKTDTQVKYDSKYQLIKEKEPVSFILDSNRDSVYKDIKNRYFTDVTAVLSNLIKSLRIEGQSSKEMALDEIKKYIATQLQESTSKKKFIVNHLNASQTIVNIIGHRFEEQHDTEQFIIQNKNKSSNYSYLEKVLVTQNDKYLSLRFMCLMAITQKLSDSEVRTFLQKFLHEFGFNYGFVHNNLSKAGFIPQEQTFISPSNIANLVAKLRTNDFYTNANRLKQIGADPTKINVKTPTCCSYVYGGVYIPLVAQISSMLLTNTPIDEIKTKLEPLGPLLIENKSTYPLQCRTILLYVIGGLTYSEIAACNLLESLTGGTIVVCSDRIISGNDIADAIITLP